MPRLALRFAQVVMLLLPTLGCSSIGPGTIQGARFDYNSAIVHSFDQQMLLNLVRLRYQDSILFLDLGSVVASYHRNVGVGVSPSGNIAPTPSAAVGASAAAEWGEAPTISYAPLQGEDFAKRLLAPIEPEAILLLSRSGWGLERLLLCTVQQINELPNGMAIGGVAPVQVRHYERFHRVAELLRSLQENGYIQLTSLKDTPGSVVITAGPIRFDDQARMHALEAIDLLKLTTTGEPIAIEAATFPRQPAQVVMSGRSLLGVMTFLAQHVNVPQEHVDRGLVRVTLGPEGKPFDWRRLSRGLFRVHSDSSEPDRAYVKVQYRDHWFWIDDADIEAKGTYTLLTQLFSLQAATGKIQPPVITIPAR